MDIWKGVPFREYVQNAVLNRQYSRVLYYDPAKDVCIVSNDAGKTVLIARYFRDIAGFLGKIPTEVRENISQCICGNRKISTDVPDTLVAPVVAIGLTHKIPKSSKLDKLREYGWWFAGKYPGPSESSLLFGYIRDIVSLYEDKMLTEKEIRLVEELPKWVWDYSRLTHAGKRLENAYDSLIKLRQERRQIPAKLLEIAAKAPTISRYFADKFAGLAGVQDRPE